MSQPSHKVQKKQTYGYRFNRLSENLRLGKVSGSEGSSMEGVCKSSGRASVTARAALSHQCVTRVLTRAP